jgi:hypothetical protein
VAGCLLVLTEVAVAVFAPRLLAAHALLLPRVKEMDDNAVRRMLVDLCAQVAAFTLAGLLGRVLLLIAATVQREAPHTDRPILY